MKRSPDVVQAGISSTLASLPDASGMKCAIFSGTSMSERKPSASASINAS
jgi:hypothetical protein